MNYKINFTKQGTIKYPLHKHEHWEIMFYVEGDGFLRTEHTDYPFSPGTAIIVPPNVIHGSVSEYGFRNISIGGDFSSMLAFDAPCSVRDNSDAEGMFFAKTIYRNRFGNTQYLTALCNAYIQYLTQKISLQNDISKAINTICTQISEQAFNPEINVCKILTESGYAEDYVRMHFKKHVGLSPIKFLTKIRIEHACSLIDIYKDTLPLTKIAEQCGYNDYIYFSKKFKEVTGSSPSSFVKQ